MKNHLDTLNEKQKEAVLTLVGPLLIVAGAGAGKTKTLTHRIVELAKEGIPPEQILAVTFTNKAAKEMRERALALLSSEHIDGIPFISTFHALGVYIIRENAVKIGLTRNFKIMDEGDAISLIKESVVEAGLDPKQFEPKKIKSVISREKGNFVTPAGYADKAFSYFEKVVADIWARYQKKIKAEGGLDFDDLLVEAVLLLEKNLDIRKHYQDRWQYIHIDEYQDTNQVQYEFAKLLAGTLKNICVVGDTDQNIYSWRGANLKNMLHFEKDFPGAKIVMLEQNYRSTKNILTAANEIIQKNTVRVPKNLFTEKEDGEKVSLHEAYDESHEAIYVADKIHSLMEGGVEAKDIAVLYRANFQSRALEDALLAEQIPYQVLGTRFFDRKEIKDTLSYLRAAENHNSLSDIKRVINFPARGIGKVTIAKIFAGMTNELPAGTQKKVENFYKLLEKIKAFSLTSTASETIKYIIKESGLEEILRAGGAEDLERLENIKELVTLAKKYDNLGADGVIKLLDDATLASDQDTLLMAEGKKADNAVRLMTVHASKGLEFKNVFITGLEQDLFPNKNRVAKTKEDGEEERRLFYVALTRAEEKVFLVYAGIRTIFGSRQINAPSEFIYDIPEHLVEIEYGNPGKSKEKIVWI